MLFTDDDKLWIPGSRLVRSARPDREGRFSFVGLPAGTYLAIAREFVESGEWEDRAFLEAARGQAQRIVLGDGGRETVALRVLR